MMLQACFVWRDLINLAQLEGGSVTPVADTNDEMCFAFHLVKNPRNLIFLRSDAMRFVPMNFRAAIAPS